MDCTKKRTGDNTQGYKDIGYKGKAWYKARKFCKARGRRRKVRIEKEVKKIK